MKRFLSMNGLSELDRLIAEMNPVLHDATFVFATLAPGTEPPHHLTPRMIFVEAEGTTVILEHDKAVRHNIDHSFPCRMITLNVHSALEAVGFLVAVSERLAQLGMGVNPVAGFYHDHLFVPEDRAHEAVSCLKNMSHEYQAAKS